MFAAFRKKIINSGFSTFKESLLAFNHCNKLLRSWFNFLAKPLVKRQLGIEYLTHLFALEYLTCLWRSFMHIRKRCGPRTKPWETAVKIVLVVELQ